MGPGNSWALAGQVLRVGLNNHGVGSSSVGIVAGVFIRSSVLSPGHSCMDGIGYVGEHQPAGPLQWALRGESGLQRDRGIRDLDQGHSLSGPVTSTLASGFACFHLAPAMPSI